jgi:YfiH family protein
MRSVRNPQDFKKDADPVLKPVTSSLLTTEIASHAFFTREGGVSSGFYTSLNGGLGSDDDPAHVKDNRARMAAALRVEPTKLLSLYQVHSPDVVTVAAPWSVADRPKADGMVTKIEGIALGIGTADCGPVLFLDERARVIGACHAGWKGALGGVIDATISAMETLGADRSQIRAALGPTISRAAYEVGADFISTFESKDKDGLAFFFEGKTADKKQFDLPAYIANRVKRAGVTQFEDLALCTYADEKRFFSFRRTTHRKESDYGRLIAAIALNR